ncbi:MAG TPA: sialidase family protein, partial [Pyrinomonadaceae bacterium]
MIRKLYKLTAAAALAVMCAAPWGAGGAARAQQISVGDTVHVSGARPTTDHHEVVVAADPARPERMIAASMAFSAEQKKGYTVVYASRDGGRSWAQTLETLSTSDLGADPWCAYGPDGTAYYSVCLCATAEAPCLLYVYSSKDGGTTWGKPAIAPASEYSARPYIAVDDTGGRYAGRAYVFLQIFRNEALGGVRRATDVALYRSRDGGAGFDPPVRLSGLDTRSIVWPGNAAVLPDGTVVAPVVEARRRPPEGDRPGPIWVDNKEPNAKLLLVKSEDGGDSLVNASTVSDAYIFYPVSTVSVMPSLAVDRLSEAFKGRVYVAWADTRSGRTEILFAHSPDGGKTWAKPITVNDDRPFAPPARGPDHFMPTLAVNREGVVGVMWYDRRDNTDNFGWHTRFAASLDGGETFLPSVRVSGGGQSVTKGEWMLFGLATQPEAASAGGLMLKFYADGSQFNGGHTAGMTTGRNGSFHPVWVDNRTGKR